jgi:hypothetical protein
MSRKSGSGWWGGFLTTVGMAVCAAPSRAGQSAAAPRGPSGGGSNAAVVAPGPIWQNLAYQEGLTPKCVAIGNAGTLVFTEMEGYNTYTRTLSSSDHNPTSPVSQSSPYYFQRSCVVRAAEQTDVRVAFAYAEATNGATCYPVVRKSSFTTPGQDWTFAFPFSVSNSESSPLGLGVSRDGQTIVATVYNRLQNKQAIAVFQPGSGTPVYYNEMLTYYQPMNTAVSADGSTLYIVSQLYTLLFDTQHHTNAYFSSNFEYPYSGMAINADGTVFAKSFAADHRVEVYHKNQSTYSLFATLPAGNLGPCAALALSDDGNTLAAGYNTLPNVETNVVFDLSSAPGHAVFQDAVGGDGPYWNTATAVSIAKDGSSFAVGLTGSLSGSTPQLLAYARDPAAQAWSNVLQAHLCGSCVDIALSADGTKVASAALRGHADQPLGGSEVDLYRVQPQDLVLDGIPQEGSQVALHFSPSFQVGAGAPVTLLQAPDLASHGQVLAGSGTLFLDRLSTHAAAATHVDSSGNATFTLSLPAGSTAIGTTSYYQALCMSPRQLSQSWVNVTIVP